MSIGKYKQFNIHHKGFTYIELLTAIAIAAILLAGLTGLTSNAISIRNDVQARNELSRDARFAMQRITEAVNHTELLLLPLLDNPNTNWPENLREQTVPASDPIGTSTLATAVLAVSLPHHIDRNEDGIADADDDGDGLIDEDLPADNQNDNASGIYLIDDDGDGSVDESIVDNNDEQDTTTGEEIYNNQDDDNDGSIDEDLSVDINQDGCSGICRVDDDGDGFIDEGSSENDDEDASDNEDAYNPLVFYLKYSQLIERIPVPWDVDGDGDVDGRDFIETSLANNVSHFRVERQDAQRLHITLSLTHPDTGETIKVESQLRVGGLM